METLTLFIDDIYSQEFGQDSYQSFISKTVSNRNYKYLTISGSKIEGSIFENVTFQDCTFWATKFDNSLFINCTFVNCKFQFTEFTSCNFEDSSFENCIWSLSKLQHTETRDGFSISKNMSFESQLPCEKTQVKNLMDYFNFNFLAA